MEGVVEKGDLVLVKGSQGVRLERVVEAIMAHKELKDKLSLEIGERIVNEF